VTEIAHLHRRPFPGSFSIERLFKGIRLKLSDHGVHVNELVAPRFSKGIVSRIQNIQWAKTLRADVFHVTGDIHYVTLGMTAEKTVLTIHDLEMLTRSKGLRRKLLKTFWFDLPLNRVAAVTVISEATKEKLLSLVDLDPTIVRVIPNFVDPRFEFVCYPSLDAPPRILLLGTKANKNLERTIQALQNIDCNIDIVGRLSDHQRQLLVECGNTFKNHVGISDDELIGLYRNCCVVCFASTEEGFGLPIIEAQATGRPVVTSNCSSMPEVAGTGAILVDPHDVDSISVGIQKALSDRECRQQLIHNGLKNCKRFQLESVAAQYADLYQFVVAQNAK
tara:strand:+ start:20885 stop:21889 length:1005 start_codon:yes stop_codon:yes gene_type:complete